MSRREKVLEFVDEGYNISVCGRHVQITEAMKQHVREKIAKLERIGDRIIDVVVTMDIQKLDHRVDIVMKYGHTVIKSAAASQDMYVSIDKAVDKLQAQLKKYLDKIHHHHMKEHPVIDIKETVYERELDPDEISIYNSEIEAAQACREQKLHELPKIVNTETRKLKVLTNNEAIMKMDLSKEDIMVFRGEEDQKIKVIYRRSDGDYGVIEPE